MTFRSKIYVFFCAFAVLLGTLGVAKATSDKYSTERIKLAKQYVATMPIESDVKAAIEALATHVAAEDRVLFRRLGESALDYDRLRAAAELSVLEVFTDKEIKAMIGFYSSPEGQAIRTKMRDYDAKMQPVMTEIMTEFVKKLQENNIVPAQ